MGEQVRTILHVKNLSVVSFNPKILEGMWVNIGKAVLVAVLAEVVKVLVEDKKK